MEGWKIAGWSVLCGLGALSFLRIVACEIERTDRVLEWRQKQAAQAFERRQREAEPVEVAPSGRAGAVSQRNGRNRDFVARS